MGATYPEKDFNYFLEMYEKGKFPIDKMISESFELKDINSACSKLENGEITGRTIIKFWLWRILIIQKPLKILKKDLTSKKKRVLNFHFLNWREVSSSWNF